jgi:hypothetical protein
MSVQQHIQNGTHIFQAKSFGFAHSFTVDCFLCMIFMALSREQAAAMPRWTLFSDKDNASSLLQLLAAVPLHNFHGDL